MNCSDGSIDGRRVASFENVEKWLSELQENATADISMMLVGNKTDLAQQRLITTEQGKDLSKQHGITFLEASALSSSNVEAAFLQILSEIYHKKASKEQQTSVTSGYTVSVDIKGNAKKPPCCAY